jgi:hypothetical protein
MSIYMGSMSRSLSSSSFFFCASTSAATLCFDSIFVVSSTGTFSYASNFTSSYCLLCSTSSSFILFCSSAFVLESLVVFLFFSSSSLFFFSYFSSFLFCLVLPWIPLPLSSFTLVHPSTKFILLSLYLVLLYISFHLLLYLCVES